MRGSRKINTQIFIISLFFTALIVGCQPKLSEFHTDDLPIDKEATHQTKALFYNLKNLAKERVLFGHQDDLAYGVHWESEHGRSDVKEITGSYPAVYGWELGNIGDPSEVINLDTVRFNDMKRWIKEGYQRGGVITLSWHMDNPITGEDTWAESPEVVKHILPGGTHHGEFKAMLDRFANFVNSLYVRKGFLGINKEMIPIIFRPYHEMNGDWFWWGKPLRTSEEYIALWRFTVEYLKDEKDIHHLLYAYSPNSLSEIENEDYWKDYPGDEYVDILGIDDYFTLEGNYDTKGLSGVEQFSNHLTWLVERAEDRHKIPALTEVGLEGVTNSTWYTQKLLKATKLKPAASRIAYVHVWRNAMDKRKPGHFYAPYPGHSAGEDFIKFKNDPLILFEDELPELYKIERINF